jgi:hypothetical protein
MSYVRALIVVEPQAGIRTWKPINHYVELVDMVNFDF